MATEKKIAEFEDFMMPADKDENSGLREFYPVGLVIAAQIVISNWSRNFVSVRSGSDSTAMEVMRLLSAADRDDEDFTAALDFYMKSRALEVFNSFAKKYSKDLESLKIDDFEELYPSSMVHRLTGAFARHIKDFKAQENSSRSDFWGVVGDKIRGLEVTLISSRYVASNGYGYNNDGFSVYTFVDNEGHIFVWMTGTSPDLKSGDNYMFSSGAVKSHDTFKNAKQTKITRVKILAFVNDEYVKIN